MAKFLLNESGRGLGDTAQTISDWLGGNKALAAFNAIAFGASRGLVDGIRGLVWSSAALLANNSYEVAKFLLNESGRGLGDTAQTISDWLGGDEKPWRRSMPLPSGRAAGWWTAFEGWCGRQGRAVLANNSYEVAKFLLNESGRGLGDTAQTISDWLGGNKALAAFNAIAFGGEPRAGGRHSRVGVVVRHCWQTTLTKWPSFCSTSRAAGWVTPPRPSPTG